MFDLKHTTDLSYYFQVNKHTLTPQKQNTGVPNIWFIFFSIDVSVQLNFSTNPLHHGCKISVVTVLLET